MISIAIPSFNPEPNEFLATVNSALVTNSNEIIIVDDCSNTENVKYFELLKEFEKNERIKVIYNNENKGRFLNSYFAISQATNKYVKKLDADDEVIASQFNKINDLKFDSDLIITRYLWNGKEKNRRSKSKYNLFNGSVIYKTDLLKEINLNDVPKNFFGDIIFIMHILAKGGSVTYSKECIYDYKLIGSTTPSKLLAKSEDWVKGYEWVKKHSVRNKISSFTLEKLDVFYELMMIKTKTKYKKPKYRIFWPLRFTPKFLKRIIANLTFKI